MAGISALFHAYFTDRQNIYPKFLGGILTDFRDFGNSHSPKPQFGSHPSQDMQDFEAFSV